MDNIMDAVKEWHKVAENDLMSAKHLLTLYPKPLEIIAYHCQQCAEKYLKSYLVFNDEDVIKTHDLKKLCNLCTVFEKKFSTLENQCGVLVTYITDTRYPPKLDLTDNDVKKAIEYAEEIRDFVLEAIGENTPD